MNSDLVALRRASHGLWLATLALMTAYLHTTAPAHRYLIARRIANNFNTLRVQEESFGAPTRDSFDRLAARWTRTAESHRPAQPDRTGGTGLLSFLRPS